MKTIIAGGRNYSLTRADFEFLDTLPITEVVSGKCNGADAGGEVWARRKGIPVKPFPADWNRYGLAAGPERNARMAEYAEACVLFPGNDGTEDMEEKALAKNLKIYDRRKKDAEEE